MENPERHVRSVGCAWIVQTDTDILNSRQIHIGMNDISSSLCLVADEMALGKDRGSRLGQIRYQNGVRITNNMPNTLPSPAVD